MHVDTTTLETKLGVMLSKEDWNLLATHHTITKPCTRAAHRLMIKRVRANDYLVMPA